MIVSVNRRAHFISASPQFTRVNAKLIITKTGKFAVSLILCKDTITSTDRPILLGKKKN